MSVQSKLQSLRPPPRWFCCKVLSVVENITFWAKPLWGLEACVKNQTTAQLAKIRRNVTFTLGS